MRKLIKNISKVIVTKHLNNKKPIVIVISGLIISIMLIDLINEFNLHHVYLYWLTMPVLCSFSIMYLLRIFTKIQLEKNDFLIFILASFLSMLLIIKLESSIIKNTSWHSWFIGGAALGLIILLLLRSDKDKRNVNDEEDKSLFNLFYINTSKVHEIAMLIDNHIMKAVERQQSSSQIVKNSYSLKMGSNKLADSSSNFLIENSNKKSVFESFDVKTTKSIMLRKIYDKIEKVNIDESIGQVLMYKDIKLIPLNIDDTMMVLNILRDSTSGKVKADENIELNLSKMLEKMLEDFTIDYTFKFKGNDYIIRIPYNNRDHFENDYSFSDLQLGTLDVIGINRGEVDFSKVKDVSAKFLKLFSESYNDGLNKTENKELKNSSKVDESNSEMQFDIKPTELTGKYILIDIVAIIQKIHFEKIGK